MSVQLQTNQKLNGLELIFDKRPSPDIIGQLKKHGFRWHSEKKLWYAKNTPDRRYFTQSLTGAKTPEPETVPQEQNTNAESVQSVQDPAKRAPDNCFASHYTSIGDVPILNSANVNLFDHTEAYFRDLNIHYRRTLDGGSVSITNLQNAGKTGKPCTEWVLNPISFHNDVCIDLANKEHIHTVSDLFHAVTQGKELEHAHSRQKDMKGVDVFSPFIEGKPLKKTPSSWNKRNFTQALLSGQIYRGEVVSEMTDDYGYDAARGFSKGKQLSIPDCARYVVERWRSLDSIYPSREGPDQNGHIHLHYSSGNTHETYVFDMSCNIRQGKLRADERAEAQRRYNQMLKASCIKINPMYILPDKVYTFQTLEENQNTGYYEPKTEYLQGHVLLNRLEDYEQYILHVNECNIPPDLLYSVGSRDYVLSPEIAADDRLIHCSQHKFILTGKALIELTAEGKYLPHIHEEIAQFGPSYEKAKSQLEAFERGQIKAMFTGKDINYTRELEKLKHEHARALNPDIKPSLSVLIGGANARRENPYPSKPNPRGPEQGR